MASATTHKPRAHKSKSSGAAKKSATSQSSAEEMSSDDMRNVLYERLHNRGLLDTLKVK